MVIKKSFLPLAIGIAIFVGAVLVLDAVSDSWGLSVGVIVPLAITAQAVIYALTPQAYAPLVARIHLVLSIIAWAVLSFVIDFGLGAFAGGSADPSYTLVMASVYLIPAFGFWHIYSAKKSAKLARK